MSETKEKDYYFPVLVSQIIIFLILTVLVYLFGSEGDFRNSFISLINTEIDSVEISNAVEAFRKQLYTGDIFTALNIRDDFPVNGAVNDYTGTGGRDIEYKSAAESTSFAPVFSTAKILPPIENGRYTSYFGYRINPISGEYGFHSGLDIAAPERTRIRAAFNGTVLKTGVDSQAGNYIYLLHDDGFVTFYCHCSEIMAEKDSVVRQGETIALVGSTGYSTGPHLHFEVRKDGIRYNPMWLLEK
ncbi:MAG: M23 family metallopeptidase [Clostridia bacterium]|nr:M23 family metallopeptidase [Clostridia bacterium]